MLGNIQKRVSRSNASASRAGDQKKNVIITYIPKNSTPKSSSGDTVSFWGRHVKNVGSIVIINY